MVRNRKKEEINDFGWKRDDYEIYLDEFPPTLKYLFKQGQMGSSPQGDIIAIKAKSKNGKSFLCTILASVILGNRFGSLYCSEQNATVLYFDTEQNKTNTHILMSRIHKMCEWKHENNKYLHVYSLRLMPLEERMKYIEQRIIDHKPNAVFIDGIADLLSDFNDITQSQEAIQNMMTLSSKYKTAVFFVLHTNKSDNNMKGHLGTLATQKCADVFQVEKKGNIFHVSESESRNLPIKDFKFTIDDNGIPQPAE